MEKLHFTIKVEPRTKKNSQRIVNSGGRGWILPSRQFMEYEKNCGYFVPRGKMITEPVNIRCEFYMKTHRKCDLTNLLEAIDDVLVHYGTIADDNYSIVAGHDGSRVYVDKQNPRTEVFIERMCENDGTTESDSGNARKK